MFVLTELYLFNISKYADEAFVNFVAYSLVNNKHYRCLHGRHSTVNNSRYFKGSCSFIIQDIDFINEFRIFIL